MTDRTLFQGDSDPARLAGLRRRSGWVEVRRRCAGELVRAGRLQSCKTQLVGERLPASFLICDVLDGSGQQAELVSLGIT